LAYHGGEIVPVSTAQVPLTTQALHYGTGVFEGIRAHARPASRELVVFRLADHYRRFLRSCRLLRLSPVPETAEELAAVTVQLLQRIGVHQDTYLRPLAYKFRLLPGSPPGVALRGVSDALSVLAFALPPYGANGVRCTISSWARPGHRAIPVRAKLTGSYVNSALAMDEARAAGCDDAILLNNRGQVAEATTANVFVLSGGQLVTPPVTADILEGITRDTVRVLAAALGLPTVERELDPAELLLADEAFLTGTGVGVTPIVEIAGRELGGGRPGPVATELRRRYGEVVRGQHEQYQHWLTRVPLP